MAKIQEYTAPTEKLTPSDLGYTAWEGAGRRIAPAYNEAAHFIEKSGVQYTQAAANAEQTAKLNDALLAQYKTLAEVYPGLESPQSRIKEPTVRSSGGGGGGVSGGGSSRPLPDPNREINNAAARLTDWASTYSVPNSHLVNSNPGGKAVDGSSITDPTNFFGKPENQDLSSDWRQQAYGVDKKTADEIGESSTGWWTEPDTEAQQGSDQPDNQDADYDPKTGTIVASTSPIAPQNWQGDTGWRGDTGVAGGASSIIDYIANANASVGAASAAEGGDAGLMAGG